MRTADMKINTPSRFQATIASVGETALQRAVIHGEETILGNATVKWIDIEVPVHCTGKPRGPSIDLIGIDQDGFYVLCELKYGTGSDTDSPSDAERELVGYVELIHKNIAMLTDQKGHSNRNFGWNGEDVDFMAIANGRMRLVLAANSAYWDYWFNSRNATMPSHGLECFSINISADEFSMQKGNRKQYSPHMPKEGYKWIDCRKLW